MSRTQVSYDDIATDTNNRPAEVFRPPKRGRWQQPSRPARQHWDAPAESAADMVYDDGLSSTPGPPTNQPAFSSPAASTSSATHTNKAKSKKRKASAPEVNFMDQNAWDDSALTQAWDEANEEYMRMHGGKSWKDEPVVKSSLWSGTRIPAEEAEHNDEEEEEEGEQEEGFDITPVHEGQDAPPIAFPSIQAAASSLSTEDAFQRAIDASYSLGYWTAVHKFQMSQTGQSKTSSNGKDEETNNGEVDE